MNKNSTPLVSIILPVFNGEKYLEESIQSILNQTYKNLELIIIDDGSTDSTLIIAHSFLRDSRVSVLTQENQGISAALNRGIEFSRGEYIGRQDHDDISVAGRVEAQIDYLLQNEHIAILGTNTQIIRDDILIKTGHNHPTDPKSLKLLSLFDAYFVHGSVMMRREMLKEIGLYCTDPKRQPPEDYELWSRVLVKYDGANLNEKLYIYREIPTSISRTVDLKKNVAKIAQENLLMILHEKKYVILIKKIVKLYHYGEIDNGFLFNWQINKITNQIRKRLNISKNSEAIIYIEELKLRLVESNSNRVKKYIFF